jgi:GTP1/Obg family GTP-binding protein
LEEGKKMIFPESLSLIHSIAVTSIILIIIFVWRFTIFKRRYFNHLIQVPSILVLGPKSSGKTLLTKELTKSEVFPDSMTDHLKLSYLEDGNRRFHVIDGNLENIERFKSFNNKAVIYVVDPLNPSFPEEQMNEFEKIKKTFSNAKFFPVINKIDMADGKKLKEIRKNKDFYLVSAKTGDGIEKLREDILSYIRTPEDKLI